MCFCDTNNSLMWLMHSGENEVVVFVVEKQLIRNSFHSPCDSITEIV